MSLLKIFRHDFASAADISTIIYSPKVGTLIIGDYNGNIATLYDPIETTLSSTAQQFQMDSYITSAFQFKNLIFHITGKHEIHVQEAPNDY